MASYQRDAQRIAEDVSDQEEEAMANDFKEQLRYDDGMPDLDHTTSHGGQMQDMQAQLAAAATPLEYQATLETKFSSYDNYCSLFHYVLNSEGPVDLEVPSVS
jgi:translation initiation factor 3 subunit L